MRSPSLFLEGDLRKTYISELLNDDGTIQHQLLLGKMPWSISLEQFDANASVMTMLHVSTIDQNQYLVRSKHVHSFLASNSGTDQTDEMSKDNFTKVFLV